MELRSTLSASIGLPLPPTLLYDHQSVTEIVTFVNTAVDKQVASTSAAAAGHTAQDDDTGSAVQHGATAAAADDSAKPSALLKTLRPPANLRPLFLAAPGVANAQSAYFSFSAFLQWSDQPIYVLDKDNDLDIEQ